MTFSFLFGCVQILPLETATSKVSVPISPPSDRNHPLQDFTHAVGHASLEFVRRKEKGQYLHDISDGIHNSRQRDNPFFLQNQLTGGEINKKCTREGSDLAAYAVKS